MGRMCWMWLWSSTQTYQRNGTLLWYERHSGGFRPRGKSADKAKSAICFFIHYFINHWLSAHKDHTMYWYTKMSSSCCCCFLIVFFLSPLSLRSTKTYSYPGGIRSYDPQALQITESSLEDWLTSTTDMFCIFTIRSHPWDLSAQQAHWAASWKSLCDNLLRCYKRQGYSTEWFKSKYHRVLTFRWISPVSCKYGPCGWD